MGTISTEIVTETWQRIGQFDVEDVPDLIAQMKDEQPVILGYLLALDDTLFNQHEIEIVFYIGIVVWQIIKQSPRRLLKVTRKKLERAETANMENLELLASDTEADFTSATQFMLERYEEPEVLRYIVEAIMDEEEYYQSGDIPIRDEYRGIAFVHLKILLDAFIDSLV
jgi:hypothetical protein